MWLISSWVFPLISAGMWLAMLLAMLIHWSAVQHSPHLPSFDKNQSIAYISDIGAFGLKPLFITGCVITTVFLDLGFVAERWLRHIGRLAHNTSNAQKAFSVLSILFAIAGTCGLILLSIFDTYRHPHLHDGFLLLFMAGYILSAIFICAEYQRLGIHYRNHRIIRISFWIKLLFILVEVALAIVFAATIFSSKQNVAAVFEWVIAFVFTFYVLSFLLDLLPSVRTRNHVPQGFRGGPDDKEQHRRTLETEQAGGFDVEQNLTNDSAGPNTNGFKGHDAAGHALPHAEKETLQGETKKSRLIGRIHF